MVACSGSQKSVSFPSLRVLADATRPAVFRSVVLNMPLSSHPRIRTPTPPPLCLSFTPTHLISIPNTKPFCVMAGAAMPRRSGGHCGGRRGRCGVHSHMRRFALASARFRDKIVLFLGLLGPFLSAAFFLNTGVASNLKLRRHLY